MNDRERIAELKAQIAAHKPSPGNAGANLLLEYRILTASDIALRAMQNAHFEANYETDAEWRAKYNGFILGRDRSLTTSEWIFENYLIIAARDELKRRQDQEAKDAAFYNTPEGRKVRMERELAEIEIGKNAAISARLDQLAKLID